MTKVFWWRLGLLVLIAVLQVSFVSMLFPNLSVPVLVIGTVMSLVLTRGFRESVGGWLSLLFISDLLRSGGLTLLVPIGIILAYAVSFVSRRFLFEHRGYGTFFLALLASGGGILYSLTTTLWNGGEIDGVRMMFDGLWTGLFFFPTYALIQAFEAKCEIVIRSEFRGVR